MRALALALVALCACKTAPEMREVADPTLPTQDFQIVTQSLTDCAVKFSGTVEGASEDATVEKAVYEFVVDQQVLASKEKVLNLPLPANGKVDFSVDENLTYVKDEAELKAMNTRGGSLLMALRGHLVIKVKSPAQADAPAATRSVDVDFARSRDVRTPRLPHLKLVDWEGGRFSESEVQVTYHLGVVNPNPFPVSLQGIDWAITLAGKEVNKGTIGAGEKVVGGSTGVFDVTATLNEETHGPDAAKKLIKGLVVPYVLTGTLRTTLFSEPLEAKGDVKLNVSK